MFVFVLYNTVCTVIVFVSLCIVFNVLLLDILGLVYTVLVRVTTVCIVQVSRSKTLQ